MEFKDVIYDTAGKLTKSADNIVKLGELVLHEKMLKDELQKNFTKLGKMMYKWYITSETDFDELESYFVTIEKYYRELKKIDDAIKKIKKT